MTIPRRLHRIWLGGEPPAISEQYWNSFRRMNPKWYLKTWREKDLRWLANQELFDAVLTFAQKADIARYEILARYGGIYVDTDVEPLRCLEPLREAKAFSGLEDETHINIGVMGCEPGHPFFREVVRRLPLHMAAHPGEPPNNQTGPLLMYEVYHSRDWDGFVLHQPVSFYPYNWNEQDPGIYPAESYAVHHWMGSWKT